MKVAALLALSAPMVTGQQVGTITPETHLNMNLEYCTASGSCESAAKSVVIDSNWRWTEDGTGTNCYDGNEWDESICPPTEAGALQCAETCTLEGAEYGSTYGITSTGHNLKLGFVTEGSYAKNVGSRTYLLNTEDKYEMFKLKNREFSVTVDVSTLPCGVNGALYFVEMDEDGGKGEFQGNSAGAKYGTGYCDAQCPHDIKYINGEANILNWTTTNENSGTGHYGTCCNELDIWEANQFSHALTPHVCSVDGQYRCEGTECGDNSAGERFEGVCDKDGCDFAPTRLGNESFYGPGSDYAIDTTSPFTLVTQFITEDGTDDSDLVEIRRFYVQNGKTIGNPSVDVDGKKYDSITDDFCTDQKGLFGDPNAFGTNGGLKQMGESLDRGMVLVMSIWDDYDVNMLWLDSDYPTDADPSAPGVHRGPCAASSGVPAEVEEQYPDAYVTYGDLKVGPIGSTTADATKSVVA